MVLSLRLIGLECNCITGTGKRIYVSIYNQVSETKLVFIIEGGPIELFLVPASAPRLV